MLARQTSDEGAIPSGSTITSVVRLSARLCVRRRHRGSRAMTRLSGPGYVWRRWLTVYEYLGGFDSLQGRHWSRDTTSGSSFNGRMLSSHGGDGGSSPPESTHSHILACVCGRPARHAIATRNNPVRLRADALSDPEGLSTNLPHQGKPAGSPFRYARRPTSGVATADPVLLAGHAPLVRERRGFDSLGRLHARAPRGPSFPPSSLPRSPGLAALPRGHAPAHGRAPGLRSLVRWFDSTRWHRASSAPRRPLAPRPRRPAVRTPAFHPGKTGSTPVVGTATSRRDAFGARPLSTQIRVAKVSKTGLRVMVWKHTL